MNEIDKYKHMFSQVHTDLKLDSEGMMKMKPKRTTKKQIVVFAIAVCIIAAFSLTAFATNIFGLQDLILNKREPAAPTLSIDDTDLDRDNSPEPPQGLDNMQLISLQGYSKSNEFKAAAEWLAFTESYDTDGAILSSVGNGPTGLDAKYNLYLVYSQEMADKLEEILAKYGLKLHNELIADLTGDELTAAVANGNFLGKNVVFSAYMYEDGTFQFDSQTSLGSAPILYQFMSYKKGSFTDALLNIGNADDYTEWPYKTACGMTVSLSVCPYKSLIIADTDTAFVTVNVLAGSDDGITRDNLEELADSFDFSLLN